MNVGRAEYKWTKWPSNRAERTRRPGSGIRACGTDFLDGVEDDRATNGERQKKSLKNVGDQKRREWHTCRVERGSKGGGGYDSNLDLLSELLSEEG